MKSEGPTTTGKHPRQPGVIQDRDTPVATTTGSCISSKLTGQHRCCGGSTWLPCEAGTADVATGCGAAPASTARECAPSGASAAQSEASTTGSDAMCGEGHPSNFSCRVSAGSNATGDLARHRRMKVPHARNDTHIQPGACMHYPIPHTQNLYPSEWRVSPRPAPPDSRMADAPDAAGDAGKEFPEFPGELLSKRWAALLLTRTSSPAARLTRLTTTTH